MAKIKVTRKFNVFTAVHKDGTLLVATSPELRGLIVHGRSEAELTERIPVAIRAILEADGYEVSDVRPSPEDDQPNIPDSFRSAPRSFEAIAA